MFDYLRQCINVRDPFFKLPDSIPLDSIHSITQLTDRLSFPIICKRRSACSSTEAHQMTILPCEKYLNNTEDWIKYYDTKEPLILQKFIQHDGVIVKIYVAGGQIHVSTRPSIVNVTPETGVIYFDSQMLPKQFDTTTSSQTVQPFVMTCDDNNIQAQKDALLDHELLQRIAITLQKQSGLTFFGFDVLLESGTNDYYVVDLNYFPSFKNVTDFQSIFVAILKKNLVSSNIDIDQI
ncbi:inositol 1, 3, 4-trisphosphate 5/6-kinase-domain-containing protein [Chlamydoabsidia padenii]|nr:inositol 1, 3, 4-trisphosphate 5/6-kinase-domain-containing protein [Chlamydoabsidia padenii]